MFPTNYKIYTIHHTSNSVNKVLHHTAHKILHHTAHNHLKCSLHISILNLYSHVHAFLNTLKFISLVYVITVVAVITVTAVAMSLPLHKLTCHHTATARY